MGVHRSVGAGVAALVLGLAGLPSYAAESAELSPPSLGSLAEDLREVVVAIRICEPLLVPPETPISDPPPGEEAFPDLPPLRIPKPRGRAIPGPAPEEGCSGPRGLGAGVILSPEGEILTLAFPVERGAEIRVGLWDGSAHTGELVGQDQKTALALLRIDAGRPLRAARLGDSEALGVGQWVAAMGHRRGFEHSLTVGIVSGLGRSLNAGPYDDFVQTSMVIYEGDGGGPLVDLTGSVVGIMAYFRTDSPSISFSIPINQAKRVVAQLREHGRVIRGWLGVQIQRVTPPLAEQFGLDGPRGALISQVFDDSPAQGAGLRRGDVILEFEGDAIDDFDDLPRRIAATAPGSEVSLIVLRERTELELRPRLAEMQQ